MAHILIAGLGDLGRQLAGLLQAEGHRVSGIRRGHEAPSGVDLYAQDLSRDPVMLPPDQVDLLCVIMTPAGRDEAGYRQAYITNPLRLLDALARRQPLPPVLFVSSTAVYGEEEGWVDESTPPRPERFNGRLLLAAEEELSVRTLSTSVRFTGIYGPGRTRLLTLARRIAEGEEALPEARYGNRIHSADCAGLLAHLARRWLANDAPPGVVIGTDQASVSNHEVLAWLAAQQGLSLPMPEGAVPGGRRVRSQYLTAGHYTLQYPDYKAGYADRF